MMNSWFSVVYVNTSQKNSLSLSYAALNTLFSFSVSLPWCRWHQLLLTWCSSKLIPLCTLCTSLSSWRCSSATSLKFPPFLILSDVSMLLWRCAEVWEVTKGWNAALREHRSLCCVLKMWLHDIHVNSSSGSILQPRANFLQFSHLKSILYFSDIDCLKIIKQYNEKYFNSFCFILTL